MSTQPTTSPTLPAPSTSEPAREAPAGRVFSPKRSKIKHGAASPKKERKKGSGGSREGSGGAEGNQNAVKYSWNKVKVPRGLDLHGKIGLIDYAIHIIEKFGEGNGVDARKHGLLSTWVRILADLNGWIPRPSFSIIQTQSVQLPREQVIKEIEELVDPLPIELKEILWSHEVERQRRAKSVSDRSGSP